MVHVQSFSGETVEGRKEKDDIFKTKRANGVEKRRDIKIKDISICPMIFWQASFKAPDWPDSNKDAAICAVFLMKAFFALLWRCQILAKCRVQRPPLNVIRNLGTDGFFQSSTCPFVSNRLDVTFSTMRKWVWLRIFLDLSLLLAQREPMDRLEVGWCVSARARNGEVNWGEVLVKSGSGR